MLNDHLGNKLINHLEHGQSLLFKNRVINAILSSAMAIVPFSILRGLLISASVICSSLGYATASRWTSSLEHATAIIIPLAYAMFLALHWSSYNRLSQMRCITTSLGALLVVSQIINNNQQSLFDIHILVALFTALYSCMLLGWVNNALNKHTTWSKSNYNFLILLSVSISIIAIVGLSLGCSLRFIFTHFNGAIGQLETMFYPSNFLSGLIYMVMFTAPWFLGIHGYYMFMNLDSSLNLAMQQGLAGDGPLNILNPVFFDVWCNAGGTGMTLCLLLNILFSRRNVHKDLLAVSLPLAFININEPLLFGVPVVLNPVMIVPFILVPALSYTLAWGATMLHIIPPTVHLVTWSAPSVLKVWQATGHSIPALILHLIILAIGTAIYRPFYLRTATAIFPTTADDSNAPQSLARIQPTIMSMALDQNKMLDEAERREAWHQIYQLQNSGTFVLYFQPQIHLRDNRITAVEVLIRHQSDSGKISPPTFLKHYERLGLMTEIDYWVLENAVGYIREHLADARDMILSINITPQTLMDRRLLKNIARVLNTPLPSGWTLEFEITESQDIGDLHHALPILKKINQMGILIALDDFGTGYSNISNLISLPLDKIKLDRAMVLGLQQPDGYAFLERIVKICALTNCTILIEGVENEDELLQVSTAGVDIVQGFHFYPPLSGGDLHQVLNQAS